MGLCKFYRCIELNKSDLSYVKMKILFVKVRIVVQYSLGISMTGSVLCTAKSEMSWRALAQAAAAANCLDLD